MPEFREHIKLEVEGENYVRAECEVSGYCQEDNPSEVFLNVTVIDNEENRVDLKYRFYDEGGNFKIDFIRTGEPAIDYGVCVAGKVGGAIGQAAWECYQTTSGWKDFWSCIKTKAPGIGWTAAKALLVCLKKLVAFD